MQLDDGAECLEGEWPRWVYYEGYWINQRADGGWVGDWLKRWEFTDHLASQWCTAPPCNWVERPAVALQRWRELMRRPPITSPNDRFVKALSSYLRDSPFQRPGQLLLNLAREAKLDGYDGTDASKANWLDALWQMTANELAEMLEGKVE